MILSDKLIKENIDNGNILIEPYDEKYLGSNSYDVHLSKYFATYVDAILDCKKHNEIRHFIIPETGFVLEPGSLYLASTVEYTETHNLVPILEGCSSGGRLGLFIDITAGFGDSGFCNHWTLELTVVKPLIVYPNMKIGQIFYNTTGECDKPYNTKDNARYNERNIRPKESMLYKSFE